MNIKGYLLGDFENYGWARAFRILLLCTVVIAGAWIIYFVGRAVVFPYPLEYREGASVVLTRFLLEHMNPFSLENQPLATNNYGILYNVATLPVAALWGNTLLAHRLITALCLALSALLVIRAAGSPHGTLLAALLAGELIVLALAARGGLGAFPSAMGTLLFLAAVLIPYEAGFNLVSLAASAILCLLAFYTKPYFVLAVGIVGSYAFLFLSKARGLVYLAFFALLFASAFFVVRALLPLYFYDTVISNLLQAGSLDSDHLGRQLIDLTREFFPAILAGLLVFLVSVRIKTEGSAVVAIEKLKPSIREAREPLLRWSVGYFGYVTLCSALAFILVLGKNPGSYLTPAFQLVLPPFTLWLITRAESRSRLAHLVLVLLQVNLVYYCSFWMSPQMLRQLGQSSGAWMRLYARADTPGKILNSPVLAAAIVGEGAWPVDSGQTEYYYFALPENRTSALVGPDQATINADGRAYLDQIRKAVRETSYARLILTDEPRPPLFKYTALLKTYRPTETITLPMPLVQERWDIVVWEPRAQAP